MKNQLAAIGAVLGLGILKERNNIGSLNTWLYYPVGKIIEDFQASLKKEPPIPVRAPDSYVPGK